MTDIVFPALVGVAQISPKLERNVVALSNPLSRTIQRVIRGGDRWRATLSIPARQGEDAALVVSWLDQVSAGDNLGIMPMFQNDLTGTGLASFTSLQTTWRNSGLTGWAGTNLIGTPYYSSGYANVQSGATAGTMARSFAVTTSAYYLVTLDLPDQAQNWRMTISDGSGSLLDTTNLTTAGRFTYLIAPRSASITVTLYGGNAAFNISKYGDLSIVRVLLAEATAAAGANAITVTGGVSSTQWNAAKAGQFVNVQTSLGWELKRLTSGLEMVGGGTLNTLAVSHSARMTFEPPLRGSLAVNAPIRHLDPYARMLLPAGSSDSSVSAPLFVGFSIELVEDVT